MDEKSKKRTAIEQAVFSVWFIVLCFFDGPSNYFFIILVSIGILLIKKNMLCLILPDLAYFSTVFVMTLLGDWKDYYWYSGPNGREDFPKMFNGIREIIKAFLIILLVQLAITCFFWFIRMIIESGKEAFEKMPDMSAVKPDEQLPAEMSAEPLQSDDNNSVTENVPEAKSKIDMSSYPTPKRSPANLFATFIIMPVCLIVYFIMIFSVNASSTGWRGLDNIIESWFCVIIVSAIILAVLISQINIQKPVSKKYFVFWAITGNIILASMLISFLAAFNMFWLVASALSLSFFYYNIKLYWLWQKMNGNDMPENDDNAVVINNTYDDDQDFL